MREAVIAFDQVSKSYPLYKHVQGIKRTLFNLPGNLQAFQRNQFHALKDISFEVYRGEQFGIIGRNGAGKSTTLMLMAGVLKPSKGRVFIRGRISPLLALGAGFHPDLTGRENIIFNGVLMGLTRKEVMSRLEEIIEFAEVGQFIDQAVRFYSQGMLARLGFSVVAHLDPEILLIDEVLGVGDIHFRRKCTKKILDFKQKGVTMVLVTHSVQSVLQLCDRALWIDNHSVKMLGEVQPVVEGYCEAAGVPLITQGVAAKGEKNILDDLDIEAPVI